MNFGHFIHNFHPDIQQNIFENLKNLIWIEKTVWSNPCCLKGNLWIGWYIENLPTVLSMIVLESSLLWQIVNNFHAICSSFYMRIFSFFIILCWNEFGILSIADKFDRRNCIRFLMKLGKSSAETIVVRRYTSGKHSNVWMSVPDEWREWLITRKMLDVKKFVSLYIRIIAEQCITFILW